MARPKGKKAAAGKPAAAAASGSSKKASAGASNKQKRNVASAKSTVKDVYSDDDDDDELEARRNAKMDIDGVYEYEQPETFEHDSEIDEDEAFNSDDEQSYGSFFSAKKSAAKATNDDEDADTVEDDDDDDDMDDADAAGGDLLSDLLGTAPAKRLSTKSDNAYDDSDDDDADAAPKDLSAIADALVPQRKRKKLDEIALDSGVVGGASAGGALTLSSLLGVVGSSTDATAASTADASSTTTALELDLRSVKKQVRDLETDGSAALQAAVAPIHEERAARKIAYTEKKADVDLFQTVVRRNRQKETLDLRSQTPKLDNLTPAALASKFEATTSMELAVEALLKAGDLSDRAVATDEAEELAAKKVSVAEVAQRQAELSKMRALMFYDEQKAKRIKKIKSKLYHKIRNNQDKKQTERQREQLRSLDPALADELDREMAEQRAEERMTLKHTNTSKWVKHQLARGTLADNATRSAIAEQLRRGDELRRKVQTTTADSDVEDDDDDEEDDDGDDATNGVERLQRRLAKQASALVLEIADDEATAKDAKGLQGMKFMQRAVQKQREKSRVEAEKLLRELNGDDVATASGLLSDGDDAAAAPSSDDDDDQAAKNKTTKKKKKSRTKAKAQVKRVVTAADHLAVDAALPRGSLQTASVSMDRGLLARSSGAVAVDLGDGLVQSVDDSNDKSSKVLDDHSVVVTATGEKTLGLLTKTTKTKEPVAKPTPVTSAIQSPAATASNKPKPVAVASKATKAAAVPLPSPTEENPWLSGAAASTKSKKRNKKLANKIDASGADVASAIASLSKAVATHERVETATVTTTTTTTVAAAPMNAIAVLTGGGSSSSSNGAKSSKKRKLDQTHAAAGNNNDDDNAATASASIATAATTAPTTKKAKATPTTTPSSKLTQAQLVQRAFAFADDGDDDANEIAKEKDAIASRDTTAKKGAELAKLVGMSGWGSWAGDGIKVSFRQQAREAQAKKLAADTKKAVLASRKDASMDRVLINEKKDKRAAKFAVQGDVPYPFTTREEYDMAMRNPLGSDWNTSAATSSLTVPKIIKRAGTIINPLALSKADKKEAKKDLAKLRKPKF